MVTVSKCLVPVVVTVMKSTVIIIFLKEFSHDSGGDKILEISGGYRTEIFLAPSALEHKYVLFKISSRTKIVMMLFPVIRVFA